MTGAGALGSRLSERSRKPVERKLAARWCSARTGYCGAVRGPILASFPAAAIQGATINTTRCCSLCARRGDSLGLRYGRRQGICAMKRSIGASERIRPRSRAGAGRRRSDRARVSTRGAVAAVEGANREPRKQPCPQAPGRWAADETRWCSQGRHVTRRRRRSAPLDGSARGSTAAADPPAMRGKVVVIEFWTYSCINPALDPLCPRVARKVRQERLVIIASSALFAFEREPAMFERPSATSASASVALDNQYKLWGALKTITAGATRRCPGPRPLPPFRRGQIRRVRAGHSKLLAEAAARDGGMAQRPLRGGQKRPRQAQR